MRYNPKDYEGKIFGSLLVFGDSGIRKSGHVMMTCLCFCGKECFVPIDALAKGEVKSCGCIIKDISRQIHLKHGKSGTKLYSVWSAMKGRCNNQRDKAYKNYGARGIKVCDEWNSDYLNFYTWAMANGYREGLTIERIDVNKGYNSENCTWITLSEQQNNRRNLIRYNGVSASKIAREHGIPNKLMRHRLYKLGWSLEEAIGIVPRKYPANWQTRAKRPGPCRRSLPKND